MIRRIACLTLLSVFLALPLYAAGPAPVIPPAKAGDMETIIFGVAWRDQSTSQWVGTVNVAVATYTGQTTEAGVATSMFQFGPNAGIGAGGFVEQAFYSSPGGYSIFGTAALEAVGGSASGSTNGIGSAAVGVKRRMIRKSGEVVTPRVLFFAQAPVGAKGSGNSAADSLNQIGVLFGVGFGHSATP